MIIEKVTFNGKEYIVYNPGSIMRSGRKCIDQLKDGITVMPKNLNLYIEKTYGLTAEEYYIIVVFRGDESKCYCKYPGCGKKLDFYRIIDGFRKGCCSSHSSYLQCKRNIEEGTHPLTGERRKEMDERLRKEGRLYGSSDLNRERMRKRNRDSVANGTNPFLSKFGLQKFRIASGSHNFQSSEFRKKQSEHQKNLYKLGLGSLQSESAKEAQKMKSKKLVSEGNHPLQQLNNKLKANKSSIIGKGNPEDILHFYVSETINGLFKIGITKDIPSRIRMSSQSHFSEDSYGILTEITSGTRIDMANLEYNLKIKVSHLAAHGTEYFDIKYKDLILDELSKLLSSTTIETTDDESGKE